MFNLTHCPLKINLDKDSVMLLQVLFRHHNSTVTKLMPLSVVMESCDELIVVSQDNELTIDDPWCSVIDFDSPILTDISKCFGIGYEAAYQLYMRFNNKLFSL